MASRKLPSEVPRFAWIAKTYPNAVSNSTGEYQIAGESTKGEELVKLGGVA
jgi:hypothetical protein